MVNTITTFEDRGCVGSMLECRNLTGQKSTGSSLIRPGISTTKVSDQAACARWWPVKLLAGALQDVDPERKS